MKKKINEYKVLVWDFNNKTINWYDVIPYFVDEYKKYKTESKKKNPNNYFIVPITDEDFINFTRDKGMYMYWSRCQYEHVVSSWPSIGAPSEANSKYEDTPAGWREYQKAFDNESIKIDVWDQIEANLEVVAKIVKNACEAQV